MKKSLFVLVKQLKEKLLEYPKIVTSLENKEVYFLDRISDWLKSVEDILAANNISEVSELAGLRSKIIGARYLEQKGSSLKKAQTVAAASVLYDAQNTVLNCLIPYEQKINESKELVKQLLAIVAETKKIKYSKKIPFESFIKRVWTFILVTHNLKPGAVKLKSVLSETDISMLIAEEIDLTQFS